jgi:hypothetical protein
VPETSVRSAPWAHVQVGYVTSLFLLLSLRLHLAFHSLDMSTLTAASDLTSGIALYVLLKLPVVPGHCTVMDAQGLDESVLIPLSHYYCKPLLKRNPCNRALHAVDSRPSPMVGNPRKVSK